MTLTPVQRDTLRWILEFEAKHHRVPTQAEVGAHFSLSKGSANHRIQKLARAGLLATRHGVGMRILPAARKARDKARIVLPEPVGLPATLPISEQAVSIVKAVYAANVSHEAPTSRDLARRLNKPSTDVYAIVNRAAARGALDLLKDGRRVTLRVSALGVGLARGIVRPVAYQVPPKRTGGPPTPAYAPKKQAERSAPIPEPEAARPARTISAPRLPMTPPPVARVVHPPIPQPGQRDPRLTPEKWASRTTIPLGIVAREPW